MSSEPRVTAIEARGLSKTYHVYARPEDRLKQMLWRGRRRFYREFFALRDVNLDVHRGETLGIVGRNGCGKSTLLKMICGILEPSAGTVRVHGHLAPLLALGAGFNPDFTGRDNVLMNAAVLGLTDEQVRDRMDSIVAFADIGDFLEEPVRSYSSGMYARLAFAIAIHADPEILVIDEILSVGDEAFTRKCFARIQHLKEQGSTILFVSHATTMVLELCDRAVLLDGGEQLLTADPKTVVAQYRRLAHAPLANQAALREEIRALGAREERPGAEPEHRRAQRPEPPRILAPIVTAAANFDPRLRPASTVRYEPRGACIERPRLLDADDRAINVLEPGQECQYAFDVRFDAPRRRARFGMMIKLVTGFELSGQASHPLGEGIDITTPGTCVEVRFRFRALLAPGAYFLNAGVTSMEGDEEIFLHRVLDAVMFRVDARSNVLSTGRVDLSAGPARIRVLASSDERNDALRA